MTTFSRMTSRVTAGLAAFALALSGCSSSDGFKLERRVVVDSRTSSGTDVAGLVGVDLSAVGDTWVNRAHLRGVAVGGVQVSVLTVDGDNTAARASGSVALRPEGAPSDGSEDVVLGTFDEVRLVPGQTLTLSAPPAAGDALEKALEGSGRLALVVLGQADRRPVGFALKVGLDVRARYTPLGRL